jgi:AcrR family transcriptional regulator
MPRTRSRPTQIERSEKMRQRLIDATIACLARDGYGNTTIGRITARARASHGATGHHFPNKAALIAAAAQELVRQSQGLLLLQLDGLTPENYDFETRIRAIWSALHSQPAMRAFLELTLAAQRDRKLATVLQQLARDTGDETSRKPPWLSSAVPSREDLASGIFPLTRSLLLGMALQYHGWGDKAPLEAQLQVWARLAAPHVNPRLGRPAPDAVQPDQSARTAA